MDIPPPGAGSTECVAPLFEYPKILGPPNVQQGSDDKVGSDWFPYPPTPPKQSPAVCVVQVIAPAVDLVTVSDGQERLGIKGPYPRQGMISPIAGLFTTAQTIHEHKEMMPYVSSYAYPGSSRSIYPSYGRSSYGVPVQHYYGTPVSYGSPYGYSSSYYGSSYGSTTPMVVLPSRRHHHRSHRRHHSRSYYY
ncbi:uncharacterized protein BT62DRAFT_1011254 [Guyanagaster necrorhizus]|uniref:Uncharacterized protein n=1 Tax=Guyanagaster necrorhizus TaxID=856835 RepID=A0A9P7VJL7_9AGAR|nr:uncharacterized protein BT62DRAFT_1011254 [Guyanagaster necrorhizus MCA 3950]KAG7441687.1 hypothetical protein BT62DRAFT_1011254 [Guyanagaster necrorhizus MCA 3950]